jgi:hypothetical protein
VRWASSSYGSFSRLRRRYRAARSSSPRASAAAACDGDVHRPGLLAQRDGPVLVGILLEEVACVDGLGRRQTLAGGIHLAPATELEPGRGLRQETLHVDVEVLELEPDRFSAGGDEAVRIGAPLRVEDRAERAERHRKPVSDPSRVAVRPERLHENVARRGTSAAGDEELEQVARLLRLPGGQRDRDPVPHDPEAPERLDRERRSPRSLGPGHEPRRDGGLASGAERTQAASGVLRESPPLVRAEEPRQPELGARDAERTADLAPDRDRLLDAAASLVRIVERRGLELQRLGETGAVSPRASLGSGHRGELRRTSAPTARQLHVRRRQEGSDVSHARPVADGFRRDLPGPLGLLGREDAGQARESGNESLDVAGFGSLHGRLLKCRPSEGEVAAHAVDLPEMAERIRDLARPDPLVHGLGRLQVADRLLETP